MASSSNNDDYEITGINVTPLVDVMLVLLIIFMVTATYIVKEAIKIELPRAANSEQTAPRTLQLIVTKAGQTFLDGVELAGPALVQKIREAIKRAAQTPGTGPDSKPQEVQAVISADREALHGKVVQLLDLLRTEGIANFAIQIEKLPAP